MPNRFFPGYPVRHGTGVEIFHVIFAVLLIAALVMLVVWLIQGARRGQIFHEHAVSAPSQVDTALQEARMRYARGEMSREEFLQISTDLGGGTSLPEPEAPKTG